MMQLGEVVFGGVGSGLYGMLIFAVLAVFIAGLMIGRTPEYLGKKIESHEMKMTSIAILATPLLVLVGTAIAVMTEAGRAGIANPGAHGFSEILYALSSAANNNGSAFAGLSANTPFYNTLLAVAMWFGRFGVIMPVLAMAGSLAAKKRVAVTAGTLPTHGPLFVTLLIGVRVAGRSAQLCARAGARPGGRAPGAVVGPLIAGEFDDTQDVFPVRPGAAQAGHRRLVPQARSARAMAQSGDVRGLHRLDPDHTGVDPALTRSRSGVDGVHPRRRDLAVVHGALRQLRRSSGRRPQQGAGGVVARPEEGNLGEAAARAARGRRMAHRAG
jgi:hypothetical protein